jgi:hypothetical protein
MSLHILPGGGFLTCADIYEYRGFIFENHSYLGPSLCKKDGELSKRVCGSKSRFWPVYEEWICLSKAQKEKTRWKGQQL